jgi:hypothetical protein
MSKKELLPAAFVILVLLSAANAAAEVHLGLTGGSFSSRLSGTPPTGSKFSARAGYALGGIIDFGITSDVRLSIQPTYQTRGANISVVVRDAQGRTTGAQRDSIEIPATYISIPVLFRVVADNGLAYVTGGMELALLQKAEWQPEGEAAQDLTDSLRSVDIAASIGVGIMPRISSFRGLIELRYTQSLRNITEPVPGDTPTYPRMKYSSFQLWFGVLFSLGKAEQ